MPRRKPAPAPASPGSRPFPVYLELKTGGGSKRALVQALERAGCYIGNCAREMIARDELRRRREPAHHRPCARAAEHAGGHRLGDLERRAQGRRQDRGREGARRGGRAPGARAARAAARRSLLDSHGPDHRRRRRALRLLSGLPRRRRAAPARPLCQLDPALLSAPRDRVRAAGGRSPHEAFRAFTPVFAGYGAMRERRPRISQALHPGYERRPRGSPHAGFSSLAPPRRGAPWGCRSCGCPGGSFNR